MACYLFGEKTDGLINNHRQSKHKNIHVIIIHTNDSIKPFIVSIKTSQFMIGSPCASF